MSGYVYKSGLGDAHVHSLPGTYANLVKMRIYNVTASGYRGGTQPGKIPDKGDIYQCVCDTYFVAYIDSIGALCWKKVRWFHWNTLLIIRRLIINEAKRGNTA